MNLALEKDIEGNFFEAIRLYEERINSSEDVTVDDYINLAFIYWQVTADKDFISENNISDEWILKGSKRYHIIINIASDKYPKNIELNFWEKYLKSQHLGSSFSRSDCLELLQDNDKEKPLVPHFFLYLFEPLKYEHEKNELLKLIDKFPTSKNKCIERMITASPIEEKFDRLKSICCDSKIKTLSEICSLEDGNRFDEALYHLEKLYESDKNNVDVTIQFLFNLWYIQLEYGCITSNGVRIDTLEEVIQEKLVELYQETIKNFSDNSKYLFFLGFMMSHTYWLFLTPDISQGNTNYFHPDSPLGVGEETLCKYLKKSYSLEPDNLLTIWGNQIANDFLSWKNPDFKPNIENDDKIFEKIRNNIDDYFGKSGLMNKYYRGLLEIKNEENI